MKDLDELKSEAAHDLSAARERREERDAEAQRDRPILDAYDRIARGDAVPYTPGLRHAPKLEAVTSTRSTRVHTARIAYAGPDRLDITRKSAGPDGIPFAPSWAILGPVLTMRKLYGASGVNQVWPRYVEDYTAEMRQSYRDHRAAWDALIARDEVTLVCYCADSARCHRTLLAGILAKLGAKLCGERAT